VDVTKKKVQLFQFINDYIENVAAHKWSIETVKLKPNGDMMVHATSGFRIKGGTWLLEDSDEDDMVDDGAEATKDGQRMAKMIIAYQLGLHKIQDKDARFELFNGIDAEEGWEDALEPSGKNAKVTEVLKYPYGQRIGVRVGLNEAGADGKMYQDFKATALNNNWVRWDETEGDEDKEVQLNGNEMSWALCMTCDKYHGGACKKRRKTRKKKRK
jgi:hypothetical protein